LNACDLACENYEKYENQMDMCNELDHIANQDEIDEQYDWLNSTLYNYSQDPSIAWTIVSIHTAPYTAGSGDGDVENLKLRLIPMLQDYEVDILLTGHDHLMQHFYIPNKSTTNTAQASTYSPSPLTEDCVLPYYLEGQTSSISQKGEGLHQVIMGASGRELEDFCPKAYSQDATLLFGDVEYGFLELYADSSKINLKYHTIDATDPVYEVTIVNYSSVITLEFEVFGKVQGVSFRKYTMNKAKELGITGWVKNTDRGTVIGTIQGPPKVIEDMKEWLVKEGSPHSEISRLVIHSQRLDSFSSYKGFEIRL
jgi:acylphosphatase